MNELRVDNLPDLLALREHLPGAGDLLCFRGQADSGWGLVPTLYRGLEGLASAGTAEDAEWWARMERDLCRTFALQSRRPSAADDARRKIELLFLAQHYGAPTRLLDWTRLLAVAAYFAVWDRADRDGAVWCLNVSEFPFPAALGRRPRDRGFPLGKLGSCVDLARLTFCLEQSEFARTPGDAQRTATAGTMPGRQSEAPGRNGLFVLLDPQEVEDRVRNQQGMFTVYLSYEDEDLVWDHGAFIAEVERACGRTLLSKVVIPAAAKTALREALQRDAGIDPYHLFPDLTGLGLLQKQQHASQVATYARGRHRPSP